MNLYELFDKHKLSAFAYARQDGKHLYFIMVEGDDSELVIESSDRYSVEQLDATITDHKDA